MTKAGLFVVSAAAALALTTASPVPEPLWGGIFGSGSGSGSGSSYSLAQSNRGFGFYSDYWDFWSSADPTHGSVNYTTQSQAQSLGLIGNTATGAAFARTSTQDLAAGQYRPSVRFQSAQAYDEAVVVFDVVKMPVGCATWPALWTVAGATWPKNGEIDVLEGIGYTSEGSNANLMSVHMGSNAPNQASSGSYTGQPVGTNCNTNYGNGNTGCSFHDANQNGPSWGPSFNSAGGGVWAVQFGGGNGVKTWFWGRGREPSELSSASTAAQTVDPASWGTPAGNFQSPIIDENLKSQNIVLDITIGGDWAGGQALDGRCAGQTLATALQTGSNYADAEFILNGIDIYTPASSSSSSFFST
jgi:hypothetical protein